MQQPRAKTRIRKSAGERVSTCVTILPMVSTASGEPDKGLGESAFMVLQHFWNPSGRFLSYFGFITIENSTNSYVLVNNCVLQKLSVIQGFEIQVFL